MHRTGARHAVRAVHLTDPAVGDRFSVEAAVTHFPDNVAEKAHLALHASSMMTTKGAGFHVSWPFTTRAAAA